MPLDRAAGMLLTPSLTMHMADGGVCVLLARA